MQYKQKIRQKRRCAKQIVTAHKTPDITPVALQEVVVSNLDSLITNDGKVFRRYRNQPIITFVQKL